MIRLLAGHAAAYTISTLLSRGVVVVWLIVLPSFLAAADYGVLGLIITTAALVNVLVPLEVTQGLARYYPGAATHDKQQYVSTAWTFTLLMLAAFGCASLLFSRTLCDLLLGDVAYLTVMRIAVLFFVLNTLFYFIQNQFRWDFRSRDYVVVTLIFAFLTLFLSLGFAANSADALTGVLTGQVIGSLIGTAVGMTKLRHTIRLGIDWSKLKKMLRFSLPLVPASFAIFLSTYASRFVLTDLLELAEVGFFTWGSQLATLPALLLLGVQAALGPLVMKHHSEPQTRLVLARAFECVLAVELILCLALGLFAPELISFLGYSSYAGAGSLVILLAPGYLMLQLYVFAPGFAVKERTDLQLLVSVVAAVTAVLTNYFLIAVLGVMGAALATLLSGAVFMGGWFLLSHWLYPTPIRWSRLGLLTTAAAVCGAVGATAILSETGTLWVNMGLVAILIGVVWALGLLDARLLNAVLDWRRNLVKKSG